MAKKNNKKNRKNQQNTKEEFKLHMKGTEYDGIPSIEGVVLDVDDDAATADNNVNNNESAKAETVTITVEELEAALIAAANRGGEIAAKTIASTVAKNQIPQSAETPSSQSFIEHEKEEKKEAEDVKLRKQLEEMRLENCRKMNDFLSELENVEYREAAERKEKEAVDQLFKNVESIDPALKQKILDALSGKSKTTTSSIKPATRPQPVTNTVSSYDSGSKSLNFLREMRESFTRIVGVGV